MENKTAIFPGESFSCASLDMAAQNYEFGKKYCRTLPNGESKWFELSCIYEYDDKGNKIHEKLSSGGEYWWEYNANGNVIYRKLSDGLEYWYDDKGNMIRTKLPNGDEHWHEYDANGNEIHEKRSNGDEYWWEYNAKGNVIYVKSSYGSEWWYDYEYDEKGNIITKFSTSKSVF